MFFFLRFVKFNNCSLNLLFVVHLDNPKTLKNPCTLEPTDFQLYRKMKRKFYFRFSFFFAAKKTKLDFHFRFSFFPRREGNGIQILLMISVFPFVTFEKTDFNFLFRFSFFIFVWNFENGLQVVFRFSFSANSSETDNLCFSGNI